MDDIEILLLAGLGALVYFVVSDTAPPAQQFTARPVPYSPLSSGASSSTNPYTITFPGFNTPVNTSSAPNIAQPIQSATDWIMNLMSQPLPATDPLTFGNDPAVGTTGSLLNISSPGLASHVVGALKNAGTAIYSLLKNAANSFGVPENLLLAQAYHESSFNPNAVNGNAVGLMQLIPRWHPGVAVNNPTANANGGAQYLAQLYDQFGSWFAALVAYNQGPTAVSSQGINANTAAMTAGRQYASAILSDAGMPRNS